MAKKIQLLCTIDKTTSTPKEIDQSSANIQSEDKRRSNAQTQKIFSSSSLGAKLGVVEEINNSHNKKENNISIVQINNEVENPIEDYEINTLQAVFNEVQNRKSRELSSTLKLQPSNLNVVDQ